MKKQARHLLDLADRNLAFPELAIAHMVGAEIKRDTAAMSGPVPLHPGAIRYFKEKKLLK